MRVPGSCSSCEHRENFHPAGPNGEIKAFKCSFFGGSSGTQSVTFRFQFQSSRVIKNGVGQVSVLSVQQHKS